ncbi:MAG: glycosyltransferase, partial [Syntrophomonadaceae bacterium]|nr:glycosyltransferase [Syntrophomonadaceae bacterium]
YADIRIYQRDEHISLGECLNFAIERANYDYIANMSDDDYYAFPYLQNAMAAFTYTDADVIGKGSLYVYFEASKILAALLPGREHCYVQAAAGATLVYRKEVFARVRYPDVNLGEDTLFIRKCVEEGIKIYSNDRFNFVYLRRPNPDDHAWKVRDDWLLESCEVVSQTDDYITLITLPGDTDLRGFGKE